MVKNVWVQPQTVVQQFMANEYVAACTPGHEVYKFTCDAGAGERGDVFVDGRNLTNGRLRYYHACNLVHEALAKDEFQYGTLVLNGGNDEHQYLDWGDWGDWGDWKDYPTIPVVVWTEGGSNVHCTTQLDITQTEPTKS